MRLARTIWDEQRAQRIAHWLQARGVAVEIQPYPADNPSSWRIWVVDEDQLKAVREWIDSIESGEIQLEEIIQALPENIPLEIEENSPNEFIAKKEKKASQVWLTQSLIFLLIAIHVTLSFLVPDSVGRALQMRLMIDDPTSCQVNEPGSCRLPWPGIYTIVLNRLQTTYSNSEKASIATSKTSALSASPADWEFLSCVRQGELWRLITPVLLHGDWLHLLFNVLWLSVMGMAIEPRLGSGRLALLMLSSGIISNLVQYLMSGYRFLGFSGIVMALVAFSYVHIRRFPWEGYPIAMPTFTFVAFYLILTLCLQAMGFILDVLGIGSMSLGIANAAHLSGLAIGWFLGRMRMMSMRA